MTNSPNSSPLTPDSAIFIAGHRGLVGSAIMCNLEQRGFTNLITRRHSELDLTNQQAVEDFFAEVQPEYVILAAAKVGGIHANNTYPAEFIRDNLAIQTNVIHSAYKNNVKRLLFLGSSCIYPRECPQPMKEEYLLTGPLEGTNQPYAVAKIAGIEMCWSYNRQYGTQYLAVMPTNLYGPGDNFNLENSHVIPALIRKMHDAKISGATEATVWGSGRPYREFLYSEDMADACVYLISLPDNEFNDLLGTQDSKLSPLINIGVGKDLTIRELAETIRDVVGANVELTFDATMPDGTPRKLLDTTRLSNLGWKPTHNLREGLKKAYEWYLDNQNSFRG